MNRAEAIALARKVALAAGLDDAIFCGLVEQESDFDNWAIRYEPAFYKKYVQPIGLPETEAQARSFSWGCCQVMGQVAREMGYKLPLPQLCDWEIGLQQGAKVLARNLKRSAGDMTAALLAYNGGGAPNYPVEVLAKAEKYKGVT